ncbi:MAG: sensor histidine kinase [Flavobacteriaceae bacterium]|nr:sensor histidine kinase [Flavobacteriaceae bacterium]
MNRQNKTLRWIQYFLLSSLLLVGCNSNEKNENIKVEEASDDFSSWIDISNNEELKLGERQDALLRAYLINVEKKEDSIKIKNLEIVAFQAYKLDDSDLFKKANKEAFQVSVKIRDTLGIADAHWNYGTFYAEKEVYDSAYSHYRSALGYYQAIKNDYYSGKMLYNMAFIKGRLKDYTGSEVLTSQAIAKYKQLNKYKSLYTSYNHLAILFKELEEYDRALAYNKEALSYLTYLSDKKTYYEGSLNNIGLIYHKQENYERAIMYFNEALEKDSLKHKNIELYARLIDNRAHSKLLNNDTVHLMSEFNESLRIRDSLNNHAGITLTKLHLAEFYKKKNDTANAILFAEEAKYIAKERKNNRDYLASLKFLSKADDKNANAYLNEFIEVNDSLQNIERKIRNKFTRIDLETDEYIEEAERLFQQKVLILVVSLCLLLILSLLYFVNRQYSKSKELQFESEQQKANEQIYLLSLEQQAKLEEGKVQERNRISEELHDGVLGKLFGTRMGLGFLNPKLDSEATEKYNLLIKELQIIEKEIRDISHELKNHDSHSSSVSFFNLVTKLIIDCSEIGGFEYSLMKDGAIFWEDVDEIVKANLYRIIQESLQNTIKFAQANEVLIDFSIQDGYLILTIIDDGVGFNKLKKKTGIGLKNMRSRAEKLNGEFTIESRPNEGTKTAIRIPINK